MLEVDHTRAAFNVIDLNGDGVVGYDEMAEYVHAHQRQDTHARQRRSAEELRDEISLFFREMDKDKGGFIHDYEFDQDLA